MKKKYYIVSALICSLLLYTCTKDFDILDEFKFELSLNNVKTGLIYDELQSSFEITPEFEVKGVTYQYDYRIIEGKGYFINANKEIMLNSVELAKVLNDTVSTPLDLFH